MNEQRNAANTNTVDIKGNITVMPEPFALEENTTINLGLANKDSKLTGVLQNTFKVKQKEILTFTYKIMLLGLMKLMVIYLVNLLVVM